MSLWGPIYQPAGRRTCCFPARTTSRLRSAARSCRPRRLGRRLGTALLGCDACGNTLA